MKDKRHELSSAPKAGVERPPLEKEEPAQPDKEEAAIGFSRSPVRSRTGDYQ